MTEKQERIERSAGTLVEVGGLPARVGSGYRGKREDQDQAVKEFARRLAEEFPDHEIQIRYNTNRLGGGAWLKNSRRNAQVGLGADLKAPDWHKAECERYLHGNRENEPKRVDRLDPAELDLRFTVKLDPPAVDESRCNRMTDREDRDSYLHKTFHTLEGAWGYFLFALERDGVLPPK